MSSIEIDLDDFKTEIRETYCNEKRCLNKNFYDSSAEKRIKDYLRELDKDIYIFQKCDKTPADILRDLQYIMKESEPCKY